MKARYCLLHVLILAAVVLGAAPVSAQQGEPSPLIVLLDGDFWQWNTALGTLEQITFWGYNQRPILSPDGTRFAYNSWAQFYVDARARGSYWEGPPPSNIWIWEIATGRAIRLADQPTNASLVPLSYSQPSAFVRSTPTWSPDGTDLAWWEVALYADRGISRLVIYDLDAGQSRALVEETLPGPRLGAPALPSVRWGQGGIALLYTGAEPAPEVLIYDPLDGSRIARAALPPATYASDFLWLDDGARQILAVLALDSGAWIAIDPLTGHTAPLAGSPELYAPGAAAGSSLVVRTIRPPEGGLALDWRIAGPGTSGPIDAGHTCPIEAGMISSITLSPLGQRVACLDGSSGALQMWENGATVPVQTVTPQAALDENGRLPSESPRIAAIWGPTAWRVHPASPDLSAPTPVGASADAGVSADQVQCSAGQPTRLRPGGQARVLPEGAPATLRLQPAAGSAPIGTLAGGAQLAVLGGPVCEGDSAWWQVRHGEQIGWSVEGGGGMYWLEPVQ